MRYDTRVGELAAEFPSSSGVNPLYRTTIEGNFRCVDGDAAHLHSLGRDERKRFGVTEVEQRNAAIHFLIGLVSVEAEFGQRVALFRRLVAQVSGGTELDSGRVKINGIRSADMT